MISYLFITRSSLKDKKILIHFLNITNMIFNSILIVPFLNFLIPMIYCREVENKYSENITCFTANHYIHFILSIICSIMIIIIGLINSYINYDIRIGVNNYNCKIDVTFDVLKMISKIQYSIAFESWVYDSNNDSFLISIIIFFNNLALYISYFKYEPYYYSITSKSYSCYVTILLFTSVFILVDNFLRFFELIEYYAYLELWFICFFITVLYYYYKQITPNEMIYKNNVSSSKKAFKSIMFTIELIEKMSIRKDYEIILNGYAYDHNNCNHIDCPLLKYREKYLSKLVEEENEELNGLILNANNKSSTISVESEKKNYFYNYLLRIFDEAINRFNDSIELKLLKILFLMEKMKNYSLTKYYLSELQRKKLSISEQFACYSISQILEEEISKNCLKSVDFTSIISHEKNVKRFKENLGRLGLYFTDFWNSLNQQDVNVERFILISEKIISILEENERLFTRIKDFNSNDNECLILYGHFINYFFGEKDRGNLILNKAKDNLNKNNTIIYYNDDIYSVSPEGNACLISHINKESFQNEILHTTFSFTRLFGYLNPEIYGKNINVLMPKIFRDIHDKLLENYNKENINSKINKHKSILSYGLHKNGYIFPVYINTIFLPSLINESYIGAIFSSPSQINFNCNLIVNQDLDIVNVSSQSLKLLNISEKNILGVNGKIENKINLKNILYELSDLTLPNMKGVPKKNYKDFINNKLEECHVMDSEMIKEYIKFLRKPSRALNKNDFNFMNTIKTGQGQNTINKNINNSLTNNESRNFITTNDMLLEKNMKDFFKNYLSQKSNNQITGFVPLKQDNKRNNDSELFHKCFINIDTITVKGKSLDYLIVILEKEIITNKLSFINIDDNITFTMNYDKQYLYCNTNTYKKPNYIDKDNNSESSDEEEDGENEDLEQTKYLKTLRAEFIKSRSKPKKKKKKKVVEDDTLDINNIEDKNIEAILSGSKNFFDVYKIENYSTNIVLFKIELDFYKILRQPIIEERSYLSTIDTNEEINFNIYNEEDEEEESESTSHLVEEKFKVDIDRLNVISSKKHLFTSINVFLYRLIGTLGFALYLTTILIHFFLTYTILNDNDLYYQFSEEIDRFMNLTTASGNQLMDILIYSSEQNKLEKIRDKNAVMKLYFQKLDEYNVMLYNNTINIRDSAFLASNQDLYEFWNSNITITEYEINSDRILEKYNKKVNLFEAIVEISSSLTAIVQKSSYFKVFHDKEVQHYLFNLLNIILEKTIEFKVLLKSKEGTNANTTYHYVLIPINFIFNCLTAFFLFYFINEVIFQVNMVLKEFLQIKNSDILSFIKKIDIFVKNILKNNSDDNDELLVDNVQESNRSSKYLIKKLDLALGKKKKLIIFVVSTIPLGMIYFLISILFVNNTNTAISLHYDDYSYYSDLSFNLNLVAINSKIINFDKNFPINNLNSFSNLDTNLFFIKESLGKFDIVRIL